MVRTIAALGFLCLLSSAARCDTGDPFAGDDRLSAKRSVHSVSVPVRDLLADLSRQSGVSFFADDAVSDEPVTVIAHDRPLSDTLRALGGMAGYDWKKSGAGSSASYTVSLSGAARKEQDAAREQRYSAAADHVIHENEEFFKVAQLPEARRQELYNELPTKLGSETDPARLEQLRNVHAVLMELMDPSARRPWAPPVRGLIRALSREDIASVLRGETLYYSWPKLPGCREFPVQTLQELNQVGRIDLGFTNGFRGELVAFRLRLTGVGARQPYLNWHLNVGQRTSQFQTTTGFMGSVPSLWAMSAAAPSLPVGGFKGDWKGDPELDAPATLKLKPIELNRSDLKSPVHRLGEALELLDKARPLNVISDSFWSATIPGFDATDAPVGEILDRLAKMTGRSWKKEGAFVILKSRDYDADRDAEPPATLVRRWTDAADRGFFSLEDMAEIAALPDPQLTTLQDMAMRNDFPVLYSPLHSGRAHLRLWTSLTASQRQKATTEGLPYRELDNGQRMKYLLAATDPGSRQLSNTPANEELLVTSKLRVATHEEQQWKVRGRGASSTWYVPRVDSDNLQVPREEAWKRFKRLDESIQLEDVVPMTKVGVTFTYESDKGAVAATWIDLPARWEGAPPVKKSGTQ